MYPQAVFIDGTHIKASVNIHSKIKKAVPEAAVRCRGGSLAEINADRGPHKKLPVFRRP